MSTVEVGLHCDGDAWEPEHLTFVEDAGFDILTTGEHIVFHRPILEAVSVLGYAAAVTSKIKLAPATLILPLRHPTMVAKYFSSLDVLSKGRIILTVGAGGDYPREFHACGVPKQERGIRSTEAIEIIKKYWSGGRFDYHGKIFQLEDVDLLPLPVQPGGPPIWVSGRSNGAMRRAAVLGDGWHPYFFTPAQCRESFSQVKAIAADTGRTLPENYVFACFIYCSMYDDVKEARDRAIETLSYRYKQPFEKIVDKYCAYGPPSRVVESLSRFVEAGASKLLIGLIMPAEERLAYIERFAKEVLPELHRLEAASVP
ncbi:MAG TPA: LLM class F420-dependent oxidoreductase [Gammaproteobacteria bacterium]|jgi:probable F420-dependent oxidoreductase|nr:LLM class F420-dependent oxidoreductase [Acidiferrobacteraceae bacterium]MDP6140519.1 LLM class flavin-dependent oxidoreductase [Arenicellales bacterium]HCV20369.1 LLM class F420-dependent oxidoreductase [Gammaproteobacteria bacterium]MDP6313257.1 LLM class flavin-dependent oxidoreductase [Arenicellales bacterium]MDP7120051.1 LLM class flavin-dependent oxidoreductase [Arenicellales bacterium]|tara:strand:- start:5593 stop:6534 length:942 start_codon:yes stop_codon:yes gene_type:complete